MTKADVALSKALIACALPRAAAKSLAWSAASKYVEDCS